jgi:hypothetical protein
MPYAARSFKAFELLLWFDRCLGVGCLPNLLFPSILSKVIYSSTVRWLTLGCHVLVRATMLGGSRTYKNKREQTSYSDAFFAPRDTLKCAKVSVLTSPKTLSKSGPFLSLLGTAWLQLCLCTPCRQSNLMFTTLERNIYMSRNRTSSWSLGITAFIAIVSLFFSPSFLNGQSRLSPRPRERKLAWIDVRCGHGPRAAP